MWREALVDSVRGATPDLSARQLAIMLTVYLEPPPHTVRGLAAELQISKPAVTRALDTLSQSGLIRRKRDEEDKRSVLVMRTIKGSVFLTDFASQIEKAAKRAFSAPAAVE
ncbi:MarR family transcriptional regulator [Oceanibacterium hippocampi]|uniref:Transcriptional regulator SlyA n=1 Tax=Oceanibacterium hippocampi TaxID=745714 RepID=A0A1Y5RTE1_9PROT|nr:MarR family transcriptional regulator [Oceanibacterium hippocampi]SLN25137.1 transcriptional regulator SlyA [Oceanibacterium hippocampi]